MDWQVKALQRSAYVHNYGDRMAQSKALVSMADSDAFQGPLGTRRRFCIEHQVIFVL
jgi:hypothetical protein